MEYLLFPKKSYFITQSYGKDTFSHQYDKAFDVSAAKSGDFKIYAPFTGYISRIYKSTDVKKNANMIIFTSDDKVMCADGITRYASILFAHPSEIFNMSLNQRFKQGEFMMNDGDTGFSSGGKHLHFEVAVGDNQITTWSKLKDGSVGIDNAVNPIEYMVFSDDTVIYNTEYQGKNYIFKKVGEVKPAPTPVYTKGVYQTLDNIRVRTGAGTNFRQKLVKELTKDGQKHATSTNPNAPAYYKKGTLFDALEIIANEKGEYWTRTPSGFVCIITATETCSKKVG